MHTRNVCTRVRVRACARGCVGTCVRVRCTLLLEDRVRAAYAQALSARDERLSIHEEDLRRRELELARQQSTPRTPRNLFAEKSALQRRCRVVLLRSIASQDCAISPRNKISVNDWQFERLVD
jgi:hypothetical protein